MSEGIDRVRLSTTIERWPLISPFRFTGHTFTALDVLLVTLEKDGYIGRGEAVGIYYRNEQPASMFGQIEPLRAMVERCVSRVALRDMLPPGGAKNALDCALWDLEAKLAGRPAWQLAGLDKPRPLVTTFGCGADTPENMASVARGYTHARAIKIKLTGESVDADRVLAVREARPDVWLGVDANQGFSRRFLEQLMPVLVAARVSLIEQPFPVGEEHLLDGLDSGIPIAADESVESIADIRNMVGRVSVINIKLDKCGGLTESLGMARLARALGLEAMVGNMIGTSLAMAPAFLIGQLCTVVDLDGPVFLQNDRAITIDYSDGLMTCPETLWGGTGSWGDGQ